MIVGKSGKIYEIKEEVAKGANSTMYKGLCLDTAKDVAIKQVKSMVMVEYKILKKVKKMDHPNLIKILDHNDNYLIFPYYPGTLYEYLIKTEKITATNIIRIMLQIVNGLRTLHDNNIAHLDLKLENIMLDENENVVIVDFNLSERVKPNMLITKLCCSQHYISPEVLQKIPFDPFKVDVWTLGILLYCLWTKRFPFDNVHKYKIADQIVNDEVTYPESMPFQIVTLLKRMLDKNYLTRYDLFDLESHLVFISYYNSSFPLDP